MVVEAKAKNVGCIDSDVRGTLVLAPIWQIGEESNGI